MGDALQFDLAKYGKWALIVGGSEGVGAACARQLAGQGFNLVLTARKLEPLQVLAQDLSAAGAEIRRSAARHDLAVDKTELSSRRSRLHHEPLGPLRVGGGDEYERTESRYERDRERAAHDGLERGVNANAFGGGPRVDMRIGAAPASLPRN